MEHMTLLVQTASVESCRSGWMIATSRIIDSDLVIKDEVHFIEK